MTLRTLIAAALVCAAVVLIPAGLAASEPATEPADCAGELALGDLFAAPPQDAACGKCDSPQGSCTPPGGTTGAVCHNFCMDLVGETGFCSPACQCCQCPEVQTICGWACSCGNGSPPPPFPSCPSSCTFSYECW